MGAFGSRSCDPPDGTTLANSSADRIFAPHGEPAVWPRNRAARGPTISDPVPARQRVVDLYASALKRPLGFVCEAPGAWS
jgi:hypothetical protein